MWYIQQNLCAFPLFDCVKQFCYACLHLFHIFLFPAGYVVLQTFILNPSTPYPDFKFSSLCPAFLISLLSKRTLSSTLPFLTAQPTIHTISQSASTIFRMLLNQSQGPLSELLAFICGIIKMLHKVVSGVFSLLALFSIVT